MTDGVTPLGWVYLLSLFAEGGVVSAWRAAKWIGALSWLVGVGLLGVAIQRLEVSRAKWLVLLPLAVCTPLAAWSVAGMETGLVLGVCAAAAACRVLRPSWAVPLAGLVAAWRPEALPWALVIAATPGKGEQLNGVMRCKRLLVGVGPAAAVALVRLVVFGRFQPLSLLAKQPDFVLGYRYAIACALLTGPIALLAFRALPSWVRALQASVLVHLLAIAAAGGDWMPLSRLMVVALPGCVLAMAFILGQGRRLGTGMRLLAALAGLLFVTWKFAPRAAKVGRTRVALIEAARPLLTNRCAIGTVDAGWVGAASDGIIVDFAGVTDPSVAALKGGHTSKRVPRGLLAARKVDTMVMLLAGGTEVADPWYGSKFSRYTEAYLAPRLHGQGYTARSLRVGPLNYLLASRTSECSLQDPAHMR